MSSSGIEEKVNYLGSKIEEVVTFLHEKKAGSDKILESNRILKGKIEPLVGEINNAYDDKLSRIQSQKSNSEETIKKLQGLLTETKNDLESLEDTKHQLESLFSNLSGDMSQKKKEAQTLVQQKGNFISNENHFLWEAYKKRSHLYSITNLAWHKKKFKCYFISSNNHLQTFNLEGLKDIKEERERLWKCMGEDIRSEWKDV